MLSAKIRREFLKYFQTQSHTIVPSSPVVPLDDPTILFTNAGMNQFKDVFLGQSKRDYTRATTSQKCIRVGGKHNDLDNVGHTSRHLTFFEMLGNFSFGDYFKEAAIGFAWDVATHIFDFNPDKIWATVFQEDDEAFELWKKHLPSSRIVRMGEKDNFWAMGDTGPCGPCSELLYDRGASYGNAISPLQDLSGERFLEFWNLVFMQFNRQMDGSLLPLPKKSVDTGAGLERIVALKMGVDSIFLTDVLFSLVQMIEKISSVKYDEKNSELAPAFHVISDHVRSLAFAIADGAIPSNVDRGYILRKLIRRAVRYGRKLGLNEPFLAKLLPNLITTMGQDYPEIKTQESKIAEIITLEEENFIRTLQRGGTLLNDIIENTKEAKISGEDAFKLKDTYGFPIEEILLIAKDSHLEVDLATFNTLEEEAKQKSKSAHKCASQTFKENVFADFVKTHPACQFIGQEKTEVLAKVAAIFTGEKFVDSLKEKEKGYLILDQTPFYAEMGGQIGDTGAISLGANLFEVSTTASPFPGVICHLGQMKTGQIKKGDKVTAAVNAEKRKLTSANHSATHLLHQALTHLLGEGAKQAGSYVDDKRLRFDFHYHKALTLKEIRELEDFVNQKIRDDLNVKIYSLSYREAQKEKSIKQFFGDKYSDVVRVIEMGASKELCGGTHAQKTGQIGFFKILKEHSIAAGIRRIEAATGPQAASYVREKENLLSELASLLKTQEDKLAGVLNSQILENKKLKEELKSRRKEELQQIKSQLLKQKQSKGKLCFIAAEAKLDPAEMGPLALDLIKELGSAVVALASQTENKCFFQIAVSQDLADKYDAKSLIASIAPMIKGGGGGGKLTAQAGGSLPEKIKEALNLIKKHLDA